MSNKLNFPKLPNSRGRNSKHHPPDPPPPSNNNYSKVNYHNGIRPSEVHFVDTLPIGAAGRGKEIETETNSKSTVDSPSESNYCAVVIALITFYIVYVSLLAYFIYYSIMTHTEKSAGEYGL